MLLAGPPGYGKTSLARAIATACGTRMHHLEAPGLTLQTLASCLHMLEHADVLFLDEAHLVKPSVTATLNVALVEYKAPDPDAETDRSSLKSISEFMLVLATNRPGQLAKALRSRLHLVELDDYATEELVEIAKRVSAKEGIELTAQAARRLVDGASSPRIVEQRLSLIRDWHPATRRLDKRQIDRFLSGGPLALDEHGLTATQRRYLRVLAEDPSEPLTQHGLVAALGCDLNTVSQDVEPRLFRDRLIRQTSRGRMITPRGVSIAGGGP